MLLRVYSSTHHPEPIYVCPYSAASCRNIFSSLDHSSSNRKKTKDDISTERESNRGVLLTIGRGDGSDLALPPSAKAVSRSHFRIILLSSLSLSSSLSSSIEESCGDMIDDKHKHNNNRDINDNHGSNHQHLPPPLISWTAIPSTDEEKAACCIDGSSTKKQQQDVISNSILAVEDVGSRFGTFVTMIKTTTTTGSENKNENDKEDMTKTITTTQRVPTKGRIIIPSTVTTFKVRCGPEMIDNNQAKLASTALTRSTRRSSRHHQSQMSQQSQLAPLQQQQQQPCIITIERASLIVTHSRLNEMERSTLRTAIPWLGGTLSNEFVVPSLSQSQSQMGVMNEDYNNIGISTVGSGNDKGTSLLVTSEDATATAKGVCAWAMDIPTVTMGWIRAALESAATMNSSSSLSSSIKSSNFVLPLTKEYAPSGGFEGVRGGGGGEGKINNNNGSSNKEGKINGNDNDTSSLPPPRERLSNYIMLSLTAGEGETLCRCGGAEIIPLYVKKGKEGKNNDRKRNDEVVEETTWKDESWWRDLDDRLLAEHNSRDDNCDSVINSSNRNKKKIAVVWLDVQSSRTKEIRDHLVSRMRQREREEEREKRKKSGGGSSIMKGPKIYCVSAREIAVAISSGVVLRDVGGNTIQQIDCIFDGNGNRSGHSTGDSDGGEDIRVITDQNNIKNERVETIEMMQSSSPAVAIKARTKVTNAKEKRGRNSISQDTGSGGGGGWMISGKRRKKDTDERKSDSIDVNKSTSTLDPSQMTVNSSANEVDTTAVVDNRTRVITKKRGHEGDDGRPHRRQCRDNRNGNDDLRRPLKKKVQRRKPLVVTSDGWLLIAGEEQQDKTGSCRSHHRRTYEEVAEILGGVTTMGVEAVTESRRNLVVATTVRELEESRRRKMQPNNCEKGTDHKRFQKNPIIAGSGLHSIAGVRMKSMVPGDCERRRVLESSQRELDKEQRAADELFAGVAGGRGVTTGSRGSAIRSFFGANRGIKKGGGRLDKSR